MTAGRTLRRLIAACGVVIAMQALAAPPYDPGALESVSGDVTRVDRIPEAGGGPGMHLVVRTDAGDHVSVALGPLWVADRYGIAVGDRLEVTGWRVVRGKPALVAAEVKRAGRVIRLRNREGTPLWRRRTR
jgi:hypothetical protein